MEQTLIVHATDLLATSEGAFDHALKLALAERARLTLVHAHTYDAEEVADFDAFPRVRETLNRWGLLAQGASQAEVSEQLGLNVTKGVIVTFDPEAGLAKLLADEHAVMVVLGTRGLEGLRRLFKGSFSEHLARVAKVPALFVPAGAEGFVEAPHGTVRLRNVLIPIDHDPDASAAIAWALRLSQVLGQDPHYHLLHVGPPGATPPTTMPDRAATTIVRQGPIVQTIANVAEEVAADLIVMATAGHKGFVDALRGSTTEGVLRRAHRALLAAPAGIALPAP